jgi:hypothetical protein
VQDNALRSSHIHISYTYIYTYMYTHTFMYRQFTICLLRVFNMSQRDLCLCVSMSPEGCMKSRHRNLAHACIYICVCVCVYVYVYVYMYVYICIYIYTYISAPHVQCDLFFDVTITACIHLAHIS